MQSVLEDHPRSTFPRRLLALGSVLAVCTSCAAPRRAPLDDACVAASVIHRAGSVAELETALALADLGPLNVPRPSSPATLDPASPDFWFACAYLYEPGVRQARRRLEAKRALAKGAGAVPSINAGVDYVGPGNNRETDVMATLDLLALLGLGPAAAAKELARAEVCEALADLESAVWAARFRVVRAQIRLAAALERENGAAAIGKEAAEDEGRITTLEKNGRGAPAELAWAHASIERVQETRARARIEAAQAREELSLASGLPPDHPAIARGVADSRLGEFHPASPTRTVPTASTDPQFLLSNAPRLRALKFKYAVAEARVRAAAAATWPGLEVGPKLRVIPDHLLTGGIVDLTLPLSGATIPAVCGALVERTAAREALEDELLRVLARNHSLNKQMLDLAGEVERRSADRRAAAEQMWRAARASFRSSEAALTAWVLGLEMRLEATLSAIETGASEELLTADIFEALPPPPAPIEGLERLRPESRPE